MEGYLLRNRKWWPKWENDEPRFKPVVFEVLLFIQSTNIH